MRNRIIYFKNCLKLPNAKIKNVWITSKYIKLMLMNSTTAQEKAATKLPSSKKLSISIKKLKIILTLCVHLCTFFTVRSVWLIVTLSNTIKDWSTTTKQ